MNCYASKFLTDIFVFICTDADKNVKKPQILSTLFPQTSPVVEPEVREKKKKEEEDEKKEHDKSWKRMKLGYLLNDQRNIYNYCEIF